MSNTQQDPHKAIIFISPLKFCTCTASILQAPDQPQLKQCLHLPTTSDERFKLCRQIIPRWNNELQQLVATVEPP